MSAEHETEYVISQAERALTEEADIRPRYVQLPQSTLNYLSIILSKNDSLYHVGKIDDEIAEHMDSNLHGITERIRSLEKREFSVRESVEVKIIPDEKESILKAISDEKITNFSAVESKRVEGLSRAFMDAYVKADKKLNRFNYSDNGFKSRIKRAWRSFKKGPSGLDEIG